jgi:HlyD family secretion protein
MKKLITIIVIVAVVVGAVLGFRYWQNLQAVESTRNLQTEVISRGTLTATVGATGIVRSNQSGLLVWKTSGTVADIKVKIGDQISDGQVLASLKSGSLPQAVILAQSDLINAQKALRNLRDSETTHFQAEQALISARKAIVETERALLSFTSDAYQDKIDKAQEKVIDAQDELEKAQEDFDQYQDLDPENQKYKDAQDSLQEAQDTYDEAVRQSDLLGYDKDLANISVDLAKARLADAERDVERLKNGPDPDDVAALEARIQAAQAALDVVDLKATFAGQVTDVMNKTGDQVSPGFSAFRVDDLSMLLVDVRVSEVDVNRIEVGQPATLIFDAILGSEYKGTVKEVAEVGTSLQGVVEFVVTVELTDVDENVKAGMTAAVNIVVDKLENILLVPNRAVRVVNGQRVVYLLKDGQLEQVPVTLGASSDLVSEVLNGSLIVGENVVLNPPQVFETNGPPPFVR